MQLPKALWALAGAALCCFLVLLLHAQFLKEGQLAAGTCEIVTLDRDSSQPRRTIARQTARCACRKGQIAGTTRARPACVDARIIKTKQWCDMLPCLEGEGCDLLINRSGWTCTQPGGRIKTTTAPRRTCFLESVPEADATWSFRCRAGTVVPWDETRAPGRSAPAPAPRLCLCSRGGSLAFVVPPAVCLEPVSDYGVLPRTRGLHRVSSRSAQGGRADGGAHPGDLGACA
ncbi:chemokine-like protein TAFA-5 isoform X2 [Vulpes vulpes]|uniref:Chemokine-like protein TAFA-5 isoform X2 n=1 Tax=Vulpes vulpes TaxID=9627 RepID=A0A3Q7V7C3_VULVU|nr:protein FAM19A5 isoform X1 [Vulpes vulpes]